MLGSGVVIVAAGVAAVLLAELLRGIRIPVVVLEIALGIIIGPQLLGWATVSPVINGPGDDRPGYVAPDTS